MQYFDDIGRHTEDEEVSVVSRNDNGGIICSSSWRVDSGDYIYLITDTVIISGVV